MFLQVFAQAVQGRYYTGHTTPLETTPRMSTVYVHRTYAPCGNVAPDQLAEAIRTLDARRTNVEPAQEQSKTSFRGPALPVFRDLTTTRDRLRRGPLSRTSKCANRLVCAGGASQ